MAEKIGTMAVYLGAVIDPLERDLKKGAKMVDDFARHTSRSRLSTVDASVVKNLPQGLLTRTLDSALSMPMKAARSGVRGLASELKGLAGTIRSLPRFALGTIQAAGGHLLADGLKSAVGNMRQLVEGSIKLAAEAEAAEAKFSALLGGTNQAKKLVRELRSFAAESPLSVTAANETATKLLAAEIKPEQITPTLRSLSDLALGNPEDLKSLVRVYTQIKAMGKLTGQDWMQIANTGTLTLNDLGKAIGKNVTEVLKLREKGEISFRDIQKAIKMATEEGGRFFGAGDKYAKTFAGQLDKLDDAWQDLKRTFGTALIEEWGLKDAASDVGSFMEKVKNTIHDLRPTLKLVGDVGKGAIQILAESGRAAGLIASTASTIFEQRFPETMKSVRKTVDELKNFKFDPIGVVNLGVSIAEGIADALETVRPVWRGFVDDFVIPITDTIQDLRELPLKGQRLVDKVGDKMLDAMTLGGWGVATGDLRKDAENVRAYNRELKQTMRWTGLEQKDAVQLMIFRRGVKQFTEELEKIDAAIKPVAAQFDAIVIQGQEPPKELEDRYRRLALNRDDTADLLRFNKQSAADLELKGKSANDIFKPIRDWANQIRQRDRFERDRAEFFKKLDETTPAEARPAMRKLVEGLIRSPFAPRIGASFAAFASPSRDKLELDNSFPARLAELAGKLNDRFTDPIAKFDKDLADLQTLKSAGKITDDTYSLAFGDLVQDLRKDAHVGPPQLPQAVEYGSQQLASMIAAATGGQEPTSVEGLLAAIKSINEQQLTVARDVAAKQAPTTATPVTLPAQ